MEIAKTQNEGVTILTITGRIDTVTAPKLQGFLTDVIPNSDKTELDFSEVDYISSAGLRVLLSGEKNATEAGKTMTLKNVSPEVMEVFDVTGFTGVLTIE